METALTLTQHAGHLIASEEIEPGVGWYYTDWLTAFGQNTSMPTIDLGKQIVDGFVDTCTQKCRGQLTPSPLLTWRNWYTRPKIWAPKRVMSWPRPCWGTLSAASLAWKRTTADFSATSL